jgi:LssY-like putative type I secretion system component LssY
LRQTLLLGALLCAALPAGAVELPAGTRLSVRLTQNVYSHAVSPGQPVDTLVIAPVRADGRVVVAAGWKLEGTVLESGTQPGREKRARLRLGFTKLVSEDGTAFAVEGRMVDVDGARETVDAEGRVLGVPARKGLPKDKDALLRLAVQLDPVALGLMEASGQTVRAAVGYDRGAEMTVVLTAPALVTAAKPAGPDALSAAEVKPLAALPAQTSDGEPLHLFLAGTREQVEAAFKEAGYVPFERLWGKAGPHAFVTLAESNGFRAAPLGRLDGQDAALVFEKQNNTLARRHRVRLWPRTDTFRGRAAWLGTAQRCVDLVFDKATGTYRHRVDPDTDAEREKVVQDLVTARRVAAQGPVERKAAARAAADRPATDGRVAVVVLQ